jgi:hypothetical protein
MDKANPDRAHLMKRIQVKGRDFDKDGQLTPKDELLGMSGLFKLKDVEERIPIDGNRLKYWYSSDGPYRKCFTKIPMGEKRSLVYVDLERLDAEFDAQWEKNLRG